MALIPAEETFNGTWPFAPHFSDASGFRQHYVDEGPREAEVLICLHGEPTWGYLPQLHTAIVEQYRVIGHMGFGKSRHHTTPCRLTSRIWNGSSTINLDDITFVCQDWGGLITGAYTIRHCQASRPNEIRYLATAVTYKTRINRRGLNG